MKTWRVPHPTDDNITLGLDCGDRGYVAGIDRNKRQAWLVPHESYGVSTDMKNAKTLSFDEVLALFPNGIHFADASQ